VAKDTEGAFYSTHPDENQGVSASMEAGLNWCVDCRFCCERPEKAVNSGMVYD